MIYDKMAQHVFIKPLTSASKPLVLLFVQDGIGIGGSISNNVKIPGLAL